MRLAPLVLVLVFSTLLSCLISSVRSQLVPAIITFGDSVVDVGNNDYIHTIFKANYPPYGRDFANQQPTGRFCNGKLATDLTGALPRPNNDFLMLRILTTYYFCSKLVKRCIVDSVGAAETLGFAAPPPAYLSPQASGQALLTGTNFASAGAGYDDHTSLLSVIT